MNSCKLQQVTNFPFGNQKKKPTWDRGFMQ